MLDALFASAFITFQACRADTSSVPPQLVATGHYFTIRKSIIIGFEVKEGAGHKCLKILITNGKTRFVVGTPEHLRDMMDPTTRAGR